MFFSSHLISSTCLHLIKLLLNKKLHQIITKDFPVQVYYIRQPLCTAGSAGIGDARDDVKVEEDLLREAIK
jgi:hypothetical protein